MEEKESVSNFFGVLAAFLFIFANAYYPVKLITRRVLKPWTREAALFFKRYLKVHMVLNLVVLFALILHRHWGEENNVVLLGSFLVSLFLTVEGIFLRYRMIPHMQKQLRMLHTQRILFMCWIVLILGGHALLD